MTGKTYHQITSYDRHRMKNHAVDWKNQPAIHKVYPGMDYRYLPRPENLPQVSVRDAASPFEQKPEGYQVTIERLSVILALAYGITGRVQAGKKEYFFRSAPSAGGLYPVEVYLAAGNVSGLPPGLYHYDVAGLGLCRLRSENIMYDADRCIGAATEAAGPELSFFLTGITFRSAWKYKARAFRYILMDTGHVLENLLMTLRAEGLSATVHYDIDREASDLLLGCDPKREICFACVRISGSGAPSSTPAAPLSPLPQNILDAGKVCEKEEVFDEIEQITLAASRLPEPGTSPPPMWKRLEVTPDSWQSIEPPSSPALSDFSITIVRRRSRRNFVQKELPGATFNGILDILSNHSKREQPVRPPYGACVSTGLLVQNVAGISPGFYICDFQNNLFGKVREGLFNDAMATACLDQQWLQNAALHFCFMTDLGQLNEICGPRGYQYALLEAGRLGEAVYLAATTFGLGCCGVGALYDGEAKGLLSLGPDSALLYLVAAGPIKADF